MLLMKCPLLKSPRSFLDSNNSVLVSTEKQLQKRVSHPVSSTKGWSVRSKGNSLERGTEWLHLMLLAYQDTYWLTCSLLTKRYLLKPNNQQEGSHWTSPCSSGLPLLIALYSTSTDPPILLLMFLMIISKIFWCITNFISHQIENAKNYLLSGGTISPFSK